MPERLKVVFTIQGAIQVLGFNCSFDKKNALELLIRLIYCD